MELHVSSAIKLQAIKGDKCPAHLLKSSHTPCHPGIVLPRAHFSVASPTSCSLSCQVDEIRFHIPNEKPTKVRQWDQTAFVQTYKNLRSPCNKVSNTNARGKKGGVIPHSLHKIAHPAKEHDPCLGHMPTQVHGHCFYQHVHTHNKIE